MWTHVKATLLAGYRSRSFQVLSVLALGLVAAAVLAGQFSGREPQTVMMDVGISGMRIVGLMMVLFWCQDLIGRDIDRRTVLFTLAYPQPRYHYLVGRFLGISLLSLITLIILGVLVVLVANSSLFNDYKQAQPPSIHFFPMVVLGLWIELMSVTGFTVLISALSTTPFLPLSLGAAFAVSGRLIGPVLTFLSTREAKIVVSGGFAPLVSLLRWVLPDLDRLDIRAAILYDLPLANGTLLIPTVQVLCYTSLLLLLAMWVFSRRQFES